ncbi:hypothetical protein C8P66_103208 [Humitalea rosea]|uniref:Uncharacterized protein n=1 Tax=Humitalea rosea TaxID=990373 RepID=A0A2W7IPL1_9PROT|nr:hypothetical protein [Humitalea rosea]PZW49182.1 hypothetical protein C8P66_103208 [Humitalea rosea]
MASNDAEFQGSARESNRDYARGWFPAKGRFIGGITYPEEAKLPKGKLLVRLGHTHDLDGNPLPDWINLTSPWWMEASTFSDIIGRGEEAKTPMDQMFRMKLALTPGFGVSNMLFWVVAKQSLRSWAGRARPVMEDPDPAVREAKGLPLAWLGGWEVVQHYVPGLRDFDLHAPTPCALASLAVLPKVPLSSYATMKAGGFGFIRFPYPA